MPALPALFGKSDASVARPTFGPTSGGVTGVLGVLLGLFVLGSAVVNATPHRWAVIGAALLWLAMCWSLLLRPRVILDPDELVLRNAVSDYRIPYARLESFVVRSVTTAFVDDAKLVGLGVNRSRLSMTRVRRVSAGAFPGGSVPGAEASSRSSRMSTSPADLVEELVADRIRRATPSDARVRRVPAWPEIVGLAVGLVVLVVGVIV